MISTNTHTFFILGRERSGTTMLRVNLNNHPKIHIPPESPFIMYLYKKYVNKKKINLFEFINDLKQEPFLHIWNIDYENLLVILEKTSPPVFSNYCKQILNQHQQENISLGDKNPTNSLFGLCFVFVMLSATTEVNSESIAPRSANVNAVKI